jgi:hypothetical protein
MIRLQIEDDDAGKLDLVLGQAHCLLGENGDVLAQSLILGAALGVRRDGGIYYPIPGDNWNSDTYEAVLTADPALTQEFTTEVTDRIWAALGTVFNYHGRADVQSLVIEHAALPLPAISADWRDQATQPRRQPPSNQARRERAEGAIPSRMTWCSAVAPSSPSTMSSQISSGSVLSRRRSPCCRCLVQSSVTRACALPISS